MDPEKKPAIITTESSSVVRAKSHHTGPLVKRFTSLFTRNHSQHAPDAEPPDRHDPVHDGPVHDGPIPDNPQPLEPWAMNHNRNLAKSRLCRLPPELIYHVALHLHADGVYLLRQVSRHFRDMLACDETTPAAARAPLRSQLYCSRCRRLNGCRQELERARLPLRKPLWCSGCRQRHPGVYFSAEQRGLMDYARICIGREGHMRVCDHFAIYWSWLKDGNESPFEANFACDDKSHGTEPIKVDIERVSKAEGASASINVRSSYKVYSSKGSSKEILTPARVLQGIEAYAGEHGMPLCPHAVLANSKCASQPWQIQIQPAIKRRKCYIYGHINPITCNSKTPLALRTADITTQPGNHCPICLMTTSNMAAAISEDVEQTIHEDSCPDCRAQYEWRWFNHTRSSYRDVYLKLEAHRSGSFKSPTDDDWLNSLDVTGPVDPRRDPEAKHILWCDDSTCSTFRRWAEVRKWAGRPDIS